MEKSVHTRDYAVVLRILREARREAGLTQTELAEQIDETQSFVSKVERGELRVDILQLRHICRALGVSLSEFVGRLERGLAKRR